ncbi:uncharacterized protein LOC128202664 [Mya arenaria]|uniref:uncharacterized protein LOC128202664 n=1 Tax=Mya arenaria TaxID=6604 RepID=UPI0022DFEB30|nr:uncharacterized protein LOC128202664 [Mya arenaria]XP_052759660.1 uncharacterized protein LOC128202664 [Mya arenaria]
MMKKAKGKKVQQSEGKKPLARKTLPARFEEYVDNEARPTIQALANPETYEGPQNELYALPTTEAPSIQSVSKADNVIQHAPQRQLGPRVEPYAPVDFFSVMEKNNGVFPPPARKPVSRSVKQSDIYKEDIGDKEFYPLSKALARKATLVKSNGTDFSLDFSGMYQLTDFALFCMLKANNSAKCSMVKKANLTGCQNITDVGLAWFAEMCPDIENVNLVGCRLITETGLHRLLQHCKKLKTLDITGTNVAILPQAVADIDINTTGYPVISPSLEILASKGKEIMKAPNFKKDPNTDIMKICVVHGPQGSHSLVKHLTNAKEKTSDPLEIAKDFTISARFKANIVECIESVSPLLVTKRTLYIFTVESGEDPKLRAKEIFGHICLILSKVKSAAFLVCSLHGKNEKSSADEVLNAVKADAKKYSTSLQTELNSDLKTATTDLTFGNTVIQQKAMGSKAALTEALAKLYVQSMEVDLSTPYSAKQEMKAVVSGLEKVCELYPEYQEMGQPLHIFLTSDKKDKMIANGVLSLSSAPASIEKHMELLGTTGNAISLKLVDETTPIWCSVEWLSNVLTVAYSSPSNPIGLVGLNSDVSLWRTDDLKKKLVSSGFSSDQAMLASQLLMRVGLSSYRKMFVPTTCLPDKPESALDYFFPEIPPYERQKADFYTVGFEVKFAAPMPRTILGQLMFLCSNLRKWMMAWKEGAIFQEGIAESLIVHDSEKSDGKVLSVYCHSFKKDRSPGVMKKIKFTVWNTIAQFRKLLDFVLISNDLPYEMQLLTEEKDAISGKRTDVNYLPDALVNPLISHHIYEKVTGETSDRSAEICQLCGIQPAAANLLWKIDAMICKNKPIDVSYTDGLTVIDMEKEKKCEQKGALFSVKEGTVKTVFDDCHLYGTKGYNGFSVQILNAEGQPAIIIGFAALTGYIEINLIKSSIDVSLTDGDKSIPIDATKLPVVGDTVTMLLDRKENSQNQELSIYRNSQCIGTVEVPNKYSAQYKPFVTVKKAAEFQVLPYSSRDEKQLSTLHPDMRLEAIDKKNPSLCCAATVCKVFEDGKVQIHFDGWGDNYDYVTTMDDPALHPIGWMDANKQNNKHLTQMLQSPHRYGKPFSWDTYCEEMECLPVPFQLFNEEQVGKTSTLVTAFVSSRVDVASCHRIQHRGRVQEFSILQRFKTSDTLYEFFSVHNRFFCLLPRNFSMSMMKYPSLQSVMDYSHQNVHVLCPGLKMDVLHLVDDAGFPLPNSEIFSNPQNAKYLINCIAGLALQPSVLPSSCSNLVLGYQGEAQTENIFLRLLFMYINTLDLNAGDPSTKTGFSAELMDVVNSALKDKDVSKKFVDGDNIRCIGHANSSLANQDIKEINLAEYSQLYNFLTRIDFQNNQLETLPDEFFTSFVVLESLNLSKNKIEKLPSGIGKLKEITEINVAHNKLTELPSDFAGLKETLLFLDISHNPLNHLPHNVSFLTKLEELHAENVGNVDLSDVIKLKQLTVLNVGYNLINSIPDQLGELPLEYLNLSGVPWIPESNYPSIVMFTKALSSNNVTNVMGKEEMLKLFSGADVDESSDLSKQEVVALNQTTLLKKYPRLGLKGLTFEKTKGFPTCIFKIQTLKHLILKYHAISNVPDEVKNLPKLTELDLSENPKLKSLSAELGALPLKQLNLKNCYELNTPPKEIVSRGFVAVMGYLKRLRLGSIPCKRTKLMMVGLGGAGKTSLVQSLMSNRYRSFQDHDEPITDGIQIKSWEIPVEDDKVTYSVWDFAGQTVYYNTHQFFLSNRAVYLLLWNVRQGYEHAGLDFWLSSIACHAPKAPIIVIGTHIDKVEKYRLPEETLLNRYPQISSFQYVSCFTGAGVEALRNIIVKLTLQQKYMGEKIPEAYLTLEKKIIQLKQEKNLDIMPFKSMESVAATCGIFDRNEMVQAIQFLHDLGAVQFFDTDFLRSMVVIYPQWIVDVMACLVTVHEGAVQKGKLMLKDIGTIWKDYSSDLHPWLLRLTEEFDLTCPLHEEEASIVPCLLPDLEPKYDWPHADPKKNRRESMMLYKFQYLPAGLFNRAQVRLNQYSSGSLMWKTGSYLKKNNHIALMLQTDDREVIVRAQGFRPENFIFIVHEMIESLINESYAGVKYDFQIPCKDCLNMNVKDPSMMSYLKVVKALELNVPFIQCDKFFHISSIQDLKESMPSDKLTNMDSHLQSSVRELKDLNTETKISTFFMYTSKNVPSADQAGNMVHPAKIYEDLRSKEFLNVSYTDRPETMDMEALTLTLKSTSVIIVGMSDEFCDNPECKKVLLYLKDVLHKPILLVLLGTTKKWQKGDMNYSFGTEVYVDMQNKTRYPHKIKELYEAIKKKEQAKVQKNVKKTSPKCFISYCWSNSHDAVLVKKSKQIEGALGWEKSDPRVVKSFLENQGVSCWLDVEQTGGVGLFHSIAEGLKDAEVMVAFVSDQYVMSKNCVMEFRYSLTTKRIPVILVVVGLGTEWVSSEVGVLAVGNKCKQVFMQMENEAGYLQVLKLVQDNLKNSKSSGEEKQSAELQRNVAFQEVLELTQRKLLRHITSNFINIDLEPYPNLFVIDFISEKERQRPLTISKEDSQSPESEKRKPDVNVMSKSKYVFRLLCEHLGGWHIVPTTIPFPDNLDPEEEKMTIENAAPYLSRIYTILKHANVKLECLVTPDGEIFQQRLEEIGVNSSDFKESYLDLRNTVINQDKAKSLAALQRCHVNGKMVWLCDEHKNASKSMTESRYQGKISAEPEKNIPIGDMPESFAGEVETESKETTETNDGKEKKRIFRKHLSSQKPSLNRQTSQMCSVM